MNCQRCGRKIDNLQVVTYSSDRGINIFCRECALLFGTCKTCKHNFEQCNFFNNKDPSEKFIVVQETHR